MMLGSIFSRVLTSSLAIALITVIYLIFIRFTQKQIPSKWIYYIGLILLAFAIMPKLQQWNIDFINNPVITGNHNNISSSSVSLNSNYYSSTLTSFLLDLFSYLKYVWLIGFIAILLFNLLRHYKFIKTVNRWSELVKNDLVIKTQQRICCELEIKKNITVNSCPFVISPLLVGLRNPQILLPQTEYAKDELYFILKHECIHYKRKDLVYKYLLLAIAAIHWFNPFMYLFARIISLHCEISCDQEVVENSDNSVRKRYLESIISVIYKNSIQSKTPLSTNYNGGKKGMERRILAIMDNKRLKNNFIITVLMVCLLGLAAISMFRILPSFQANFSEGKSSIEFVSQSSLVVGFNKETSIYIDENTTMVKLQGKITTDGTATLQFVSKSDGSVAYSETFYSVKDQKVDINLLELQPNSYYKIVFSSEDAKVGKLKLVADQSLIAEPNSPEKPNKSELFDRS